MGIFRSEDIELYRIEIHKDSAWRIMNELGQLNKMHFVDLNKGALPFSLKYTNVIKRANTALTKVEFIEDLFKSHGIEMKPCENINAFTERAHNIAENMGTSSNELFDGVEL